MATHQTQDESINTIQEMQNSSLVFVISCLGLFGV